MHVEHQAPAVCSLIIVDAVHRDAMTGKFSLLGTYSEIVAPSFPCMHPSITAYFTLRGGRGRTPIQLTLIDEHEKTVLEHETVVCFPDPLTVAESVFRSDQVLFAEPGIYRLQLYGAGQLLQEHCLTVRLQSRRAARTSV
jgi:hypothetical protein